MRKNIVRITHFISFSGEHLPATAENYAADAAHYTTGAVEKMALSAKSTSDHDRNAYALQARLYAKSGAHCALRAMELAAGHGVSLVKWGWNRRYP